jgi:hypothetical protein
VAQSSISLPLVSSVEYERDCNFLVIGTIGGWLSMLCGFSLVSLAELMFFLGWLTLKLMFKRKMEKKQTPAYILNGGKVPI